MKKTLTIISILGIAALAASCKGDDYSGYYSPTPTVEIIDGNAPLFPAEGGEATINVNVETRLKASSNKAWLDASVVKGEVTLIAEPNPGIMARYAEVLLIDGKRESVVYVQQKGLSTKFEDKGSWTVAMRSTGGALYMDVTETEGVDAGQYFVIAVPEAEYKSAGVGDDTSLFLSINTFAEKAKIGKTLYSGTQSIEMSLSKGVYYFFVIGISSEKVCNFDYSVLRYNYSGSVF